MERVAIVGPSGSGTSALAELIADRIGARQIDLDALAHAPDGQPTPTPKFRARVADSLDVPRWVVAGNHSQVMDIVHGSADTIVWLDLARALVTWRMARHSIRRAVTREELRDGKRESWRNLVSRDPERNSIVWAWTQHARVRDRYASLAAGTFWNHADLHRLRSRREVVAFTKLIPSGPVDAP